MEAIHSTRLRCKLVGVLLLVSGLLAVATASQRDATSVPPPEPSAQVREVLDRGPVGASELQPVEQEEVEPSRLPFVLLGTFAASDPSLSRATLRHRETQETLVARVGDEIDGNALVLKIERERVLLRDRGSIAELRLDAERAPSEGSGVPVPAVDENPPQIPEARSPAALLADLERSLLESTTGQARVLPELDGDQLVGLHVSAVEQDSRFAELGIEDGDVITEFNGVAIDSPFVALHVVREMVDSEGYHVMVRRGDAMTHLHARWDGSGS